MIKGGGGEEAERERGGRSGEGNGGRMRYGRKEGKRDEEEDKENIVRSRETAI